jgi:hypothetical protein
MLRSTLERQAARDDSLISRESPNGADPRRRQQGRFAELQRVKSTNEKHAQLEEKLLSIWGREEDSLRVL